MNNQFIQNRVSIFIAFIIVILHTVGGYSQCEVNGINGQPFLINDNTSFDINIEVTDDIHNDLNGIQGICGVRLNFEHTLISDLQIDLIAPNDSTVTLIGPALRDITTPSLFFPIRHDILFIPNSEVAAPDPSTPDQWTNANPNWAATAEYTGTYYPSSGDFETAFSIGPVNGVWIIRVSDSELNDEGLLNSVELLFCDPSGITCLICEADGGSYNSSPIEICEGDFITSDQWSATSLSSMDDYGFIYILDNESGIEVIDADFPFESLQNGNYFISAINVANGDSADIRNDLVNNIPIDSLSSDYCFDVSDMPLQLIVLPLDTLNTELPFCNNGPTFFEGLEISNPDTTIIRPGTGCVAFERVIFTNPTVNASISGDTIIIPCNPFSVFIDASNSNLGVDGQVSWSRNGTLISNADSVVLGIDFPGLYELSIDDNGCISKDSILAIFEFEVKEYELFNDGPITCSESIVSIGLLDENAVFSANWTGPGILGDSTFVGRISVDMPGTYKVMGIDTSSCHYREFIDVELENNVEPISISSDTFLCNVDEIVWDLSTEATSLIVNWTQGPNTGSGSIMTGSGSIMTGFGSFIVSTSLFDTIFYNLTGSNGCTLDTFYEIPLDTNFVSVVGGIDTLNCLTDSIILDPNSNNLQATFEWSIQGTEISTDPIIDISEEGEYQVIASLLNGCVDTAVFNISIDTLSPLISATQDEIISCAEDSAILEIEVVEGAQVNWQYVDVLDPTSVRQVVFDSGTYNVEVINPSNGCISQRSFHVQSTIADPIFSIEKGDVSCSTPMGFFRVVSNENVVVEIVVNGGDPILTDEFEISDTASISYIVTGENSCSVSGFEFINDNSVFPQLNVPNELALDCIENTVILKPEVFLAEIEELYFVMMNGDTVRNDSLIIDMASNVEVVAIGINQCVVSEEVIIVESLFSGGLDLEIEEGMFCDKSELEVDLSLIASNPQIDFSWSLSGSDPSIFETPNSVILSGDGLFILELTDNVNNCTISDSFNLSFTDSPLDQITFTSTDESCSERMDGSLILDAISGGEGMISTLINGMDPSLLNLDSLSSGVYDIMISDEIGCTRDTSFVINPGGGLFFELGEDRVVFPREAVDLSPIINSDSEITSSSWFYNGDVLETETSISFIPAEEGILSLVVSNADGCEYIDFINITRALALEDLIYIPNMLAPTSVIGNNLLLGSFSERISGITSFSIFDRWGNLIHRVQNFLPGQNLELWDGRVGGKMAASGVYVFYVEVVLENGQSEKAAGDITVIY